MRGVAKIAGAAVVAGGAYYLYKSQFDVKQAEKLAHSDFDRASSAVKAQAKSISGKVENKDAQWAGKQVDDAVKDLQNKLNDSKSYLDKKSADASKDINSTISNAGASLQSGVDKASADTKKAVSSTTGWLSSWFGGSK